MSEPRPVHRRLPLTLQLASVLTLATIGLALVVGLVVTDRDQRSSHVDAHAAARRAGIALAQRAAPLLEQGDDLRLAVLAASVADVTAARVLLLDANGTVRLDTGLRLGGHQLTIESQDGIVQRPTADAAGGSEILVPALSNSGFAGEVRIRYRPDDAPVSGFAWDVFGTALLCGVSLLVIASWIVHQWLLRVRVVAERVRALGDGESIDSPVESPALGDLGDSLQAAGQRIVADRIEAREAGLELARRLARSLEQRGLAIVGHGDRTRRYAMLIADSAELPREVREVLETAAGLIDLGKVAVRSSALGKRGELSEVERESLRQAPTRAASLLAGLPHIEPIAQAIRHHHEKYDGTGYPDGLRGPRIPVASRVLAIADAYDLLTSDERGGGGRSWPEALEAMHEDRGEHFDPELLDLFEQAIRRDPTPRREAASVVLERVDLTPYKLADEPVEGDQATDPEVVEEFDVDFELELLQEEPDAGGTEDGR